MRLGHPRSISPTSCTWPCIRRLGILCRGDGDGHNARPETSASPSGEGAKSPLGPNVFRLLLQTLTLHPIIIAALVRCLPIPPPSIVRLRCLQSAPRPPPPTLRPPQAQATHGPGNRAQQVPQASAAPKLPARRRHHLQYQPRAALASRWDKRIKRKGRQEKEKESGCGCRALPAGRRWVGRVVCRASSVWSLDHPEAVANQFSDQKGTCAPSTQVRLVRGSTVASCSDRERAFARSAVNLLRPASIQGTAVAVASNLHTVRYGTGSVEGDRGGDREGSDSGVEEFTGPPNRIRARLLSHFSNEKAHDQGTSGSSIAGCVVPRASAVACLDAS